MPVTQTSTPTRAAIADSTLPPMRSFATPRPVYPRISNQELTRDFLELAFRLESGATLPILTRFESPISVRVTGSAPPHLASDLNRLLHRLRTEAGINIAMSATSDANITIQAVSRAEIRRALPNAACFVVPNISDLSQYRRGPKTSWSRLQRRERVAIFLPNDASPQEVRDCLHEELAQALGPLNDLYRLPDSVFNDDNIHTVLSGYDMMILRAYYDPSLQSGMTRRQVSAKLPAIFARINPGGNRSGAAWLSPTPRDWIVAVQKALGPGTAPRDRMRAGMQALRIAEQRGWQDHRRGFSHYAMGRLLQSEDPSKAQTEFILADQYYARSSKTRLHRAYVASQLAAYALSAGDAEQVLRLVNPHLDTAARYENAALLSSLMMMRAEALELAGRASEGQSVRLDSLGWARYGYGADWVVRAKLREISALNPIKR